MDKYERLKAKIPEIAMAVNEFKSEQVQQQAFRALLQALGGDDPTVEADDEDASLGSGSTAGAGGRATRRTRRAPKRGGASPATERAARPKVTAPTDDRTLNLTPKGAKSFIAFVAEKKPTNGNERNVVAVYYLARILGQTVNVNKVYTCYKAAGWRVPANLRNALQVTASTKVWTDTANMDDIKVAPLGENEVEIDLPAKPKK